MDGLKALIPDDAADPYIGAAKKTRANWRVLGVGPAFIRVGRKIFYHPDDINAWVNSRRASSTSELAA